MRRNRERRDILTEGFNDQPEIGNSPTSNSDFETSSNKIPEFPFCWTNIILEMFTTTIVALGIFFVILVMYEFVAPDVPSLKISNDYIEASYLVITFIAIVSHIMHFRWNRNCWYDITFDNYPMLFALCFYVLFEIFYYIFNYIHSIASCSDPSQLVRTSAEMFFMTAVLPFTIISVGKNVRKNNIWLKFRTKVTIILTMVGCMMIFARKTAVQKLSKPINGTDCCSSDPDLCHIKEMVSTILNILELIDINYFSIAFVLLINPLIHIGNHDESKSDLEGSLQSPPQYRFSMITSLSLVRFRLLTISLSLALICISCITCYFYVCATYYSLLNPNKHSENAQLHFMLIYLLISSFGYIIAIIYGIFYYFVDIRRWKLNKNQEYKSDQYFNYATSSVQLFYSFTQLFSLLSIMIKNPDQNFPKQYAAAIIVNYLLRAIQILIQFISIDSASRRTIRTLQGSESETWTFKLIPPVILTAFNFIRMMCNQPFLGVIQDSFLPNFFVAEENGYLIAYLTSPLAILNRFHGITFFLNLSIKQWQ